MLYLEEHRAVGEGVQAAQQLAEKHEQYTETALVSGLSIEFIGIDEVVSSRAFKFASDWSIFWVLRKKWLFQKEISFAWKLSSLPKRTVLYSNYEERLKALSVREAQAA